MGSGENKDSKLKGVYLELEKILRSKSEFVGADNTLLKQEIINYLHSDDKIAEILELLLLDESIKDCFFKKVKGNLIFLKDTFIKVITSKEFLPDSYTAYREQIGLSVNGKFLSECNEVVLDFPYKDCVLVGGQTKEDTKSTEVFYNTILAKDEIDRLLSPKVFTNIIKYSKEAYGDLFPLKEEKITEFNESDNLIIKGNNLFVLSSLLSVYENRIKSIIIDPPYYFKKTKNIDTFNYNSSFKLSTWLTFCKNRFELAKKLLRPDGFLCVMVGIDGYAHLKLLLDEIFNVQLFPKNHIGTISWRKTDNQSNVGDFANVLDYVLLYRNKETNNLYKLPLTERAKKEYIYEDKIGKYRRANILDLTRGQYQYNIVTPDGSILSGPWMLEEEEYLQLKNNGGIHWPQSGQQIPYGKIYLKDSIEKGQISSDFWDSSYGTNQRSSDEIKNLFGGRLFEFAKPELLIQNLITLTSKTDDIVMDFFAGSGTTLAVAHKMQRKFIGVEQLDYVQTVPVKRLQNVLNGEQGGISQAVNWKGGGSFVYCELAQDTNSIYLNKIKNVSDDELNALKQEILDNCVLRYEIATENALKNFEALEPKIKRQILYDIIDQNYSYINYDEMEDKKFKDKLDEQSKAFTRSFYSTVEKQEHLKL